MQPAPKDWPRLSPSLYYDDPAAAIDWLCNVFGFDVRLKVEGDGRIIHSELTYDGALIMVSHAGPNLNHPEWPASASPKGLGGAYTAGFMVYVDDADVHCAKARAAGATIIDEPKVHDYGADYWSDRSYGALDCEGHIWWFTQRLRNPPEDQVG